MPLASNPSDVGAAAGVAAAPAAAETSTAAPSIYPRIVNGTVTDGHPAAGALLVFEDASATTLYGLCSGTLIGCHTFLTAAHCVCSEYASSARECEREGLTDPSTMRVFLQHGGFFRAASVVIAPDYSFAEHGDLAVITLAEEVTGIEPSAINTTSKPAAGTFGTIVGFGRTDGGFRTFNDAGVKREGKVRTTVCGEDISNETNVCWEFSGADSNVCSGDSGGPLFIDFGSGLAVAGVTSGSYSFDCEPPDMSFDSDVFGHREWLVGVAGADLGGESCALPRPGTAAVKTVTRSGQMSSSNDEIRVEFDVPAGTARLRVGLNGQMGSGSEFFAVSNDFDLYVRALAPPTTATFDCGDTNPTTFGFCDIESPQAGTWHALVHLNDGEGTYQLTVTTFAGDAANTCAGDCDGDGSIDTRDLLSAVEGCLHGDASAFCAGAGDLSIAELVAAVGRQGVCAAP